MSLHVHPSTCPSLIASATQDQGKPSTPSTREKGEMCHSPIQGVGEEALDFDEATWTVPRVRWRQTLIGAKTWTGWAPLIRAKWTGRLMGAT